MTKNPEIVGAFARVIDAPSFTGRFWFATLIGLTFVGCVCGLILLGAAVMAGSRGVSGKIVDFSLQNAATVQSATQYIRFNQIFAEGDLPQGQSLSAVVGTQTVPLQMDVLSRYADGSVKSAILTIAAPAIAAGATLQGSLVASSAAAGAAVANNAALAQGYDLTVNMNISGFGAVTISAAQQLAAAVAGGDFEVLRQGRAGYRDPLRCGGHPRAARHL